MFEEGLRTKVSIAPLRFRLNGHTKRRGSDYVKVSIAPLRFRLNLELEGWQEECNRGSKISLPVFHEALLSAAPVFMQSCIAKIPAPAAHCLIADF